MSARYVDPIAVERLMAGDRLHVRPIERHAAIQQMTAQGLSASEIADRIGVSTRSVVRIRRRPTVTVSGFGEDLQPEPFNLWDELRRLFNSDRTYIGQSR